MHRLFPFIALFFLAASCLSLVEIGGRMQNPVGADDEDLPVHHFVNATCKVSQALIKAKPPSTFEPKIDVHAPPAPAVLPPPRERDGALSPDIEA